MICSKIANFNRRLALHQNGVESRQQFIGAIKNSLTASHDVTGGLQHGLLLSFHTIIHHLSKTALKFYARTLKD